MIEIGRLLAGNWNGVEVRVEPMVRTNSTWLGTRTVAAARPRQASVSTPVARTPTYAVSRAGQRAGPGLSVVIFVSPRLARLAGSRPGRPPGGSAGRWGT